MGEDRSVADRVLEQVESGPSERARAALADVEAAPTDDRKETLRRLRSLAEADPSVFDGRLPAVAPFLTDADRSVRLSAAKLVVAVASENPESALPVVGALAGRLAEESEFYYVRARAAEALGYVALEYPDAVASPEVLADLRVGLAFDEPEVREKLAKAIEHVALGDPDRLGHLVSRLTAHLDDEAELVRYHLCTALVAVGTAQPGKLTEASEQLQARLDDPNPYVRGRAAEALGLLAGADADRPVPSDALAALHDDEAFVADRVRFARRALDDSGTDESPADSSFGTLEAVQASTERATEALTTRGGDGTCPGCGLELPDGGPPMCPRCGAPR